MKKNMNKIVSLVLALSLCMCMGVTAFAAEIDTSGGAGSTPVSLSSTDDGTLGGDPSATALRVTVPTALPMAMNQDGDVTTATDCKIVNNSFGAVRVASVTITAADDWSLTAFGDKSILAGEKVDSNQIGFAISIGGGDMMATDNSNEDTQAEFRSHRWLLHDRCWQSERQLCGCQLRCYRNSSLQRCDQRYRC